MGEEDPVGMMSRPLPLYFRTIGHGALGLVVSPVVAYLGSFFFELIAMSFARSLLVFEAIVSLPLLISLVLGVWLIARRPQFRPFAYGVLLGSVLTGFALVLVFIYG